MLFEHGKVINLGTLPGGAESFAQEIDDQGQVAGFSSNGIPDPYSFFGWGTETRGFVWRDGVMRDLSTLGGPDTGVADQNNRGQIVGQSYTNDTPNADSGNYPTQAPYLWQNGHMRDLGTLGGDYGQANWVNDNGEVVGFSYLAGDNRSHPFLWNGRRMTDLGTLGGDNGYADSVSDSGAVIGNAQTADGSWRGFLWQHGKIVELPAVDGTPQSGANSVNDEGQVVGNTNGAQPSSDQLAAVLWTHGTGYDLNTLIAPSSLQLYSAQYVNDQGDILAQAQLPNGDQHIVELVRRPHVPLPTASTPAPPVTAGVADQSPTAEFALTAGRHGIRTAIHRLMLRLRQQQP